jgi:hypothetical protein
MAELHRIKLYNLPQKVEGGVKIHGLKDKDGKDITILFHHLDGIYSYSTVDGSNEVVFLNATTPLISRGDGEYDIDNTVEEEKTY